MSYFWDMRFPIDATVNLDGYPVHLIWGERVHPVAHILKAWRNEDEWWTQPIDRIHYKVITETGLLVVIMHDLIADLWYLRRMYD